LRKITGFFIAYTGGFHFFISNIECSISDLEMEHPKYYMFEIRF